jgi:hypothetical protein
MAKYTEEQKQQARDYIQQALVRVGVYMQQTMGFPLEDFIEKTNEMSTARDQMRFLDHFYKRHPKVFEGLPKYHG